MTITYLVNDKMKKNITTLSEQFQNRCIRIINISAIHDDGGRWAAKLLGFEYLGSFSVTNFEAFCE